MYTGSWRHRSRVLSLAASVLVAVWLVSSADASSAERDASSPAATSFCQRAVGVASDLVGPASILTPTQGASLQALDAKLKAQFENVKTNESALTSSAPASISSALREVVEVDSVILGDLQRVQFNFLGLLRYHNVLAEDVARLRPQLAALKAYFKTSCEISVTG